MITISSIKKKVQNMNDYILNPRDYPLTIMGGTPICEVTIDVTNGLCSDSNTVQHQSTGEPCGAACSD